MSEIECIIMQFMSENIECSISEVFARFTVMQSLIWYTLGAQEFTLAECSYVLVCMIIKNLLSGCQKIVFHS